MRENLEAMASFEKAVDGRTREPDSDEEADGLAGYELPGDAERARHLQPRADGKCMTGPKGVLQDRERHLQALAAEREERLERLDELARSKVVSVSRPIDEEADDEEFMARYREKRLREIKREASRPRFEKVYGNLCHMTSRDYAEAIDNEPDSVFVVIHIYDSFMALSIQINKCLKTLAQQYPMVKFCKILAVAAGVSESFVEKGLPALLVYKGGALVGNFIAMANEFGEDESKVTPQLIASFLKGKECLPDVDPEETDDLFA